MFHTLVKRRRFVVICALICCFFACGKRRPPLPPLERISQNTEALEAVQRGNLVILTFPAPRSSAPNQSVQSIRRIDVYRLVEPVGAPPQALTEEEYSSRSTLVGSIPDARIRAAQKTLAFEDELELGRQPVQLRYAVRFVNSVGQRAAFSNFVIIQPSARIGQAPANLTLTESEPSINLSWLAPSANIDQSAPANVLGYNVYRADAGAPDFAKLNAAPVPQTDYVDRKFSFGREYRYLVRAVSLGAEGAPVESRASHVVAVRPADRYPPAPPEKIAPAAARPGVISLYFPASTSADVSGYYVYRSLDENTPLDQWKRLNAAPITRNTFVDDSVVAHQKYYYYLVAVDTSGNPSAPSKIVSETAF